MEAENKTLYNTSSPTLSLTKESSRGRQYVIVKDGLHVAYRDKEFEFTIAVDPGFMTDGASLPRIVRPFINPLGDWFIAAVAHDWIYCRDSKNVSLRHNKYGCRFSTPCSACDDCNPKSMRHAPCDRICRLLADIAFYKIMIQESVSPIFAIIFYYSVRMFGWLGWKKRGSKVATRRIFSWGWRK